jgi:Rnl2 family RNA ligase
LVIFIIKKIEKAHGANFSFITNGKSIECAKRTSKLNFNETFFNFQKIFKKYENNILDLSLELKKNDEKIDLVYIFGELIGGIYPHKETEDLGNLHVQKGVYYTPDYEFYAFDILTVDSEGKETWMDYEYAMKYFETFNFFYSKPLFKGTLEECFKNELKFNSTIPKELNLPELEKNIVEGVIIKKLNKCTFKDERNNLTRLIFKHKNKNYLEINPKHENTLYEQKRSEKNKLFEEVDRYLNENRAISLESKNGLINDDNLEEFIILFAKDVLEDFIIDFEESWSKFEHKDTFIENLEKRSKGFLSGYFKNKK